LERFHEIEDNYVNKEYIKKKAGERERKRERERER